MTRASALSFRKIYISYNEYNLERRNIMIKYIKNDFKSVREGLNSITGREVPIGIAIPYYIIVGLIALPLMPFALLYRKSVIKKYTKDEA